MSFITRILKNFCERLNVGNITLNELDDSEIELGIVNRSAN